MPQSNNTTFIVGTRGSVLALAQTNMLLEQLKAVNPGIRFVIKTIKTSGDLGLIQEIGAFVKEVENALLKGEIDLAIHSYKDMPTGQPAGLSVASVPKRGEHRDSLISRNSMALSDLPKGAKIGTSSLRRAYQVKALREDVEIVPLHGNIISRMNKVEAGELDGVILALAGLQRVNMEGRASQVFATNEILPAVSQGALAIEIRENDARTREVVIKIHDHNTAVAVEAERSFLSALGGGCRMPMAAFARLENNTLKIDGLYCSPNGMKMESGSLDGDAKEAAEIGEKLARKLLKRFE